ncbi:MAG TPA: DUF362 domain-containing protein [Spirochaetota bacterium]|nr:DUF362 domain-containing protein [Spirochaetota bacterium]HOM11258.1 DUF362 domain-containing protein [Spirochaetota bacterium]HPP50069.1 DUF362 domain-containing protein [Spirochaetota bacterium]
MKHTVALTQYNAKGSIKKAIELSRAFKNLKPTDKVFIKPNIVFWAKVPFPKWGVITTSSVLLEVVELLQDYSVNNITIGEGIVTLKPNDRETANHAFEYLGYYSLATRYGVKVINIFDRPFEKVAFDNDIDISLNTDALHSDFLINIPVLKTHAQTVVSLGLKNLKGLLNIPSRKKFHNPDENKNLHYMISRLYTLLPKGATIIDGIFTLERGPSFDGKPRKSNIIIASEDTLSADLVGTRVLGHDPATIAYLDMASKNKGRKPDLSDVAVVGESIDALASFHEYTFPYNKEGTLPEKLQKMGVQGLSYPKYDSTMCTYCAALNGAVLTAITFAWQGKPWNDVEVLTGKKMQPSLEKKYTILLGQCMVNLHKNNTSINAIPVKGCPPDPKETVKALHQAGIEVNPLIFEHLDIAPTYYMERYKNKPEFDEKFYTIDE